MSRTNLDMDVLRTFVAGFDLGSFARAADRLGRSQSAVSTQLRKLEEQVGEALVRKVGRGLAPTPAGEALLGYARRILELNDEAVDALRAADLAGVVRLGLPQDFAESWLPAVLGRFVRANPAVRIEVMAEGNGRLAERVSRGELDVALAWGEAAGTHATLLARVSIAWIGREDFVRHDEPLPLIAFQPPCVFRDAGLAALDKAGIAWRLSFTSVSLAGLFAAAAAGLGVTPRTRIGVPAHLGALDPKRAGLPKLPRLPLALHLAEAKPPAPVARLAEILRGMIEGGGEPV